MAHDAHTDLDRILENILTARVYEVAKETPLEPATILSQRLGARVLLKREDLQPIFTFKIRGAYNKIANLTQAQRDRGVIAASAGNHAQGVALAATHLGCKSLIVMPRTTPMIKLNNVRRLGGKAVLHGDTYDEAYAHAKVLAKAQGFTLVHPYDDPLVIAGQGTVAMEMLRQVQEPVEAIFVPVGGGGLIAGVAAYVKRLRPSIKIIGVEPEDAPTLYTAMAKGKRVVLPQVGIFADGVAVKQIGALTFQLARQYVDETLLVSADEICAAIKDIFEDTRSIAEPAGALAVAGVKKYVKQHPRRVAKGAMLAIVSGANTNFDRLRYVAERADIGERREALLAVTIPERPGSFREFCLALGRRQITEFNYRFADPKNAHVFVGVQVDGGSNEHKELIQSLRDLDYPVLDMTDNEMAKLHIRYMVGGAAPGVKDELVYRFQFPERPGALLNFLSKMGKEWNITMFHYRNHGAAYGRVLVGVQVKSDAKSSFKQFLRDVGYHATEETCNPAFELFLRPM